MSIRGIMSTALLFASMEQMVMRNGKYPGEEENVIRETESERKIREEIFKNKQEAKRGLKRFYYGENFVLARDQKNADRKALKLGFRHRETLESEAEYIQANERVSVLMDMEFELESETQHEIRLLVALINDYQSKHYRLENLPQ